MKTKFRNLIAGCVAAMVLSAAERAGAITTVADLAMFKVASASSVQVGQQMQFFLTLSNGGPGLVTGTATVTDLLPAGFQYVSSAGNGSYNPNTGAWTVVPGAPGTTNFLAITVQTITAGNYTNTAAITTLPILVTDPNLNNNSASVVVNVVRPTCTVSIFCPSNIVVASSVPAAVFFTINASDSCSNAVFVTTTPPSGSTFPIGTNTVTSTAYNFDGTNICSFTVTVLPPPIPQAPEYFFSQPVLPPVGSVYLSPAQWWVLFDQGIVIRNVRHRFYTQNYPLPALGNSQSETYSEEMDFELSMDNGTTFQPSSATANVTVQVTHTQDAGGTMFFNTEMTQLDLSGPGFRLRASPTLPSTGQTTVRPVTGGYMISSFFDIFMEASVDGGNTWQPAQQSGHVEMHPDPKPVTPVAEPTALLPSPNGEYVSPQRWFALYAQGIVIQGTSTKFFTGALPPPAPGVTNTQNFNAQMDLQLSTDGGNTYQYARAAATVQMTVASHSAIDDTIYDTALTSLSLNLPDGIMVRSSQSEPSRGEVEVDAQPDGTYQVTSFFDVFTELSLDGGNTWSPATNAPVRLVLTTPAAEVAEPTPNLPPLAGEYIGSPAQWFAFYANGIIITNASLDQFTQTQSPPAPGTSQTESFGASVSGLISVNGGASFTPFSAPASVSEQVNSRADLDTNNTRFFDTEILTLNLSGGTLPGGMMVRASPTLASLGRTSVRTNAPNDYRISSFFDLFTEISLDGGNTWSPGITAPGTIALTNNPQSPINLICSSNLTVNATSSGGATVFFNVTATGGCSPPPLVVANPPSGSTFPIGTTTVDTTASDSCGDSTNCSFTVTVNLFNAAVSFTSVALVQGGIELAWPTNPALVLQQNDNLATPNWTPVIGTRTIINGDYHIVLPLTNAQDFYKLVNP
ncbi:MAG: HYR domain-containing protein [Verrucomicrobiia bacterium]